MTFYNPRIRYPNLNHSDSPCLSLEGKWNMSKIQRREWLWMYVRTTDLDPPVTTCKLQIGFKIPLHFASSCPVGSYFQACCDGNFPSFFSGTGRSTRGHTTREPAIGISRCHYAGQDHINNYIIYQYAASIIINHYHGFLTGSLLILIWDSPFLLWKDDRSLTSYGPRTQFMEINWKHRDLAARFSQAATWRLRFTNPNASRPGKDIQFLSSADSADLLVFGSYLDLSR